MRTKLTTILLILALLLTGSTSALADGIVIPDMPPVPDPIPLEDSWLTIRYHRVDVTIEGQVAVTHVEQEFVNEHEWEAEGTYIFPLPEGAAVSKFTMWVDGQPIEGKILTADEARAIYEDTVRRRRDPALLEYVGRGAVQARIFPIPPGGSRKIELEYSQGLPADNGLIRYVYPLNTEKFSARPLENVSVHVTLRSQTPIRALYSPTHQDKVYIERDGDYRATVGYEEQEVLPDEDFELDYTVGQDEVGLHLLTYRETDEEDGFFLLLVSPAVAAEEEQVIPRDIILVLDTSGSMEGDKLSQAKDALAFILGHLNSEDRFNVISFSTGLRQYAGGLRPASEADEAIGWVRRLQAVGGTDINRALLEALSQADEERPTVLIFLTDGLPTEGEVNVERILANVRAAAPSNVRIFPFGVGDDVNTVLLDTLAEQGGGVTGYVRPYERIDEEVSGFYAQISTPVLSNVRLDFGGVLTEDLYPDLLPDLFAGTQLVLVGRYRDGGATRITLTGEVNGVERQFVYEGDFRPTAEADADSTAAFIPRLWATRKIGHLLTQIRLHGEQPELVDAVVSLSVRYGIITPYTSFLVEEEDILSAGGQNAAEERFMLEIPAAPTAGAAAVEEAESQAGMRSAFSAAEVPEEVADVVRTAGDKTFILQNGVWTDTRFNPDEMTTTPIAFGSEAYFDMLAEHPEWGDYLAVGTRVIFVAGGTAYEVVGEDEESASWATATPAASGPTAPPTDTEVRQEGAGQNESETGSGTCVGALALAVGGLVLIAARKRK